jgi:hypothetical protein
MKNALKLLAAVLVLGGAQSALAAPYDFKATLTGPNESPPNASPGTGSAEVIFDPDPLVHSMRVIVSFSGLLGTTTASHIHCCTPSPFTGTAGVATTTPTFAGFPLGVTSGTYDNTLDMLLATSYNPTFVTAHGGNTAQAEADLLTAMLLGETYLNIHSSFAGGGEIRGFLVFIPEPMTLSVFGAGLAGAAALRRRKKKPA